MYHEFRIRKKDGSFRTIHAPSPELKKKLRRALSRMYITHSASSPAHGFVPGKNIVSGAKPHCGKRYILNVDIQDFFPSCKAWRAPFSLPKYLNTREVFTGYTRASTNGLPQGSPLSPHLANLYLTKFDNQITAVLREYISDDVVYTRYADDLTFSSNSRAIMGYTAFSIIRKSLRAEGFGINMNKVRTASKGQRHEVTGLIVNGDKPSVPKEYRKKVRAILHRATQDGWSMTVAQWQKLRGMIAYISSCHKEEAEKYLKQLLTVKPLPDVRRRRLSIRKEVKLEVKEKKGRKAAKQTTQTSRSTASRRVRLMGE